MIAVDTSALIAILLNEPDAQKYAEILESYRDVFISAASIVELRLVMKGRKGSVSQQIVDNLIHKADLKIIPVTEVHLDIITKAMLQYHPILNYGDLFSYALAKEKGLPLLFKGDDFAQTDIGSVL